MAKEQNLSLNPTKISGVCGRLMCCLSYEFENYKKYLKGLPKEGEKVTLPEGKAKVISVSACGTGRRETDRIGL
jgi:cell fate regulator YaaT (PSP1 superfamily)